MGILLSLGKREYHTMTVRTTMWSGTFPRLEVGHFHDQKCPIPVDHKWVILLYH
jgi:hypothetical protein